MLGSLRTAFDRFAGRGTAAVTIPAMDGALRPNTRLEDADVALAVPSPDNLAVTAAGAVCFSSGPELLRLEDGRTQVLAAFDAAVTAVAVAPDGTLAVGLDDGSIHFIGGRLSRPPLRRVGDQPLRCPTALAFADAETLLVCQGSAAQPPSRWQWSLLEEDRSGSVWRCDLGSEQATCLASALAFPSGIAVLPDGASLVIAEAWRHRLLRLPLTAAGPPVVVLDNLPGYPARIATAADGGYWLAVFAPRSQLIELVLREKAYKRRMMREIADPGLWIAPAHASGESFLEPLQGGAVKQMGILKPWAPTRSYGLAVRLDAGFLPVDSLHSRADGSRHGIRSCLERGGRLLVASAGGNKILDVSLEA